MDRVVVVADSGVLSISNRRGLKQKQCDYILAARLRALGTRDTRLLAQWKDTHGKGAVGKTGELVIKGERLVIRYCPQRARKDAHTREKAIARAKKKLNQSAKGNGKSARFLHIEKGSVTLNAQAIEKDSLYDGLHGVFTSLDKNTFKGKEIYRQYRQLWEIENSFRVLKYIMKIRPVYHWKESRVRAHVAICYTAFSLLRILLCRYNISRGSSSKLSEQQLLKYLSDEEVSILHDQSLDNRFILPAQVSSQTKRIYRLVKLKVPTKTLPMGKPNLPK